MDQLIHNIQKKLRECPHWAPASTGLVFWYSVEAQHQVRIMFDRLSLRVQAVREGKWVVIRSAAYRNLELTETTLSGNGRKLVDFTAPYQEEEE